MKKSGFSLIELLIVIGIISLLLSMSIPVLNRIKGEANLIKCKYNLKQLYILFSAYNQDNGSFPYGFKDAFPPIAGNSNSGNPSYDYVGKYWLNYLGLTREESKNKDNIFWCPSNKIKKTGVGNILCGNYGVNRAICKNQKTFRKDFEKFSGPPLSLSNIEKPSETLLLVDSGYALISWHATSDETEKLFENKRREKNFYLPGFDNNMNRQFYGECYDDAVYGRHSGNKINIGFADGHVSSYHPDIFEPNGIHYFWKP